MKELLPIALKHTEIDNNTQLFVADNASTDDSVEWLTNNYPNVPLVKFEENHGFAGGYNMAIEAINSDYYVLLSSDVEVSENWLPPLITELKKDNSIGACQPKVMSYHRRDEFEYAGAAGGFIDHWGVPFCRGRIFSKSEVDLNQYNSSQEIFWASGCCFAVNGKAWKEASGLDTDFFAHMEEIDLCWRMQGLGYKIMAFPNSTVYHMGGQTLSYDNPKKLYLNCRNNYSMLLKNWPSSYLLYKLPLKFFIDWVASIYFLFTKGFPSFIAIIKGQLHFLFRFSYFFKKRKATKRKEYTSLKGVYSKSIIHEHFILKKDVFSLLEQKEMS